LTLFRVLSAPAIFILAQHGAPAWVFALLLTTGFLSDILDGILARHWGTDSPALRGFDSLADVAFYLGVLLAIWKASPLLLAGSWWLLGVILFLEGTATAFSFIRFGKAPANHAYASKFWGILLFMAATALLVFHREGIFLKAALYWGILCELENIAILALLPVWRRDIPGFWQAYRWRRKFERKKF
jgi:CDP-diacylglycerol--glycerol-3-phosphate 3-phosphatidyltransferase